MKLLMNMVLGDHPILYGDVSFFFYLIPILQLTKLETYYLALSLIHIFYIFFPMFLPPLFDPNQEDPQDVSSIFSSEISTGIYFISNNINHTAYERTIKDFAKNTRRLANILSNVKSDNGQLEFNLVKKGRYTRNG